ncbi:MAG: pyridoxal phosphate-dependent aminotransferase [Bacteroidota bacterium]
MPVISRRGKDAYTSPIRHLGPYADAAKAEGKKVYHLNIGNPDINTPALALEKVRAAADKIVPYSPSKGFTSYRKKLVGYYKKFGANLSYEDIIITNGASEGILFSMFSCLDAGDEVIIPEPFYAIYNAFSYVSGVKLVTITSSIENGYALPSAEEFERCITPRTKAIFICNPNNPTGNVYSRKELEDLGAVVKKHDLFFFVDEVYREFSYEAEFYSVLNIKGLEENVVVIDSVSKRFSACGARVGALVSKNPLILENVNKYAEFRLSPPHFGQILAEATLDVDDSYINEVKLEYLKRRNLIYQRLSNMQDVVCKKPKGAFYILAKIPIDDSVRFCKWLLTDFEHEGATVMVAPASGFYATPGKGKQEIRLAYVLNCEAIDKAMDCLEVALKVYPGRIVNDKPAYVNGVVRNEML